MLLALLLPVSSLEAQLSQRYQSREECVNLELQKYRTPSDAAYVAATRFCNEYFVKIEAEKIRKCGFDYDKALGAGATHEQILRVAKGESKDCLR